MANYLLLHGAASTGWIWHRVEAGLTHRPGRRDDAPALVEKLLDFESMSAAIPG